MSTSSIDVFCVGNPFCDRSAQIKEETLANYPSLKKGQTMVTNDSSSIQNSWQALVKDQPLPIWSLGGSGTNVIRTLAHLGHKCALNGIIGNDDNGKIIEKRLNELGITTLLTKGANATGMAHCYVTTDTERTMHTFLGATTEFSENNLNPNDFKNAKHVHIEGYTAFNGNVLENSLFYAKWGHATISLDLASQTVVELYKTKLEKCMDQVDIIFGNKEEFFAFTGKNSVQEAVRKFKFEQTVVVTDGAQGCSVKGRDSWEVVSFQALKVPKVIDTTGAGDYFAGGFLHAALQDNKTDVCVKSGNLAASYVIQELGADLPDDKWGELKEKITKLPKQAVFPSKV